MPDESFASVIPFPVEVAESDWQEPIPSWRIVLAFALDDEAVGLLIDLERTTVPEALVRDWVDLIEIGYRRAMAGCRIVLTVDVNLEEIRVNDRLAWSIPAVNFAEVLIDFMRLLRDDELLKTQPAPQSFVPAVPVDFFRSSSILASGFDSPDPHTADSEH